MFLKERQEAIASLVEAEGRVAVSDLAARFDVSEDCIRKDLKTLSDEGRVHRVYGGAIRPQVEAEREPRRRLDKNVDDKRAAARDALALIEEGDTVFLDVSSTTYYLAELLSEAQMRVTVVSTMIDILQLLSKNPYLKVLGTGGVVSAELNGFVGAFAAQAVAPMNFDKAFLGALGVDMESGDVTTFDVDDGAVKSAVLERAANAYLLLDRKKLGAWGTYRYAGVADFTAVICDPLPPEVAAELESLGASVL